MNACLYDHQVISAMGPPGGARNVVDPRFVSLFMAFNVQFPSTKNLTTIYEAIMNNHTSKFVEEIKTAGQSITGLTLELYTHIVNHLPPTPSRFHYIFNLRDLSRIYEVRDQKISCDCLKYCGMLKRMDFRRTVISSAAY